MEINENMKQWLTNNEKIFQTMGAQGGKDLCYILSTILAENKYSFINFLLNASNGNGCNLHEGLYFSLENDFDANQTFNGPVFFVGDMESSTLKISAFLILLGYVCCAYISFDEGAKEIVNEYMSKIADRYFIHCG